jgi:hypothetical protein
MVTGIQGNDVQGPREFGPRHHDDIVGFEADAFTNSNKCTSGIRFLTRPSSRRRLPPGDPVVARHEFMARPGGSWIDLHQA